jgi:hypothetical protein
MLVAAIFCALLMIALPDIAAWINGAPLVVFGSR